MAGEEGSRVAAQETRARLVGKFRDVPPPPRPGTAGAFREEARADMPGAPGLGLGAAGESVQAVSCAPGGTGCSRAGPGGDTGITRLARLSQPPLVRLLRPLARQGLGCAGHLGWGWGRHAGGAHGTAGSRVSRCAGREVAERTSAGKIVSPAVGWRLCASLLQAATRICSRISSLGGGGGGGGVMAWD